LGAANFEPREFSFHGALTQKRTGRNKEGQKRKGAMLNSVGTNLLEKGTANGLPERRLFMGEFVHLAPARQAGSFAANRGQKGLVAETKSPSEQAVG